MLFHLIILLLQLKSENSTTCRALLVFVKSKTKYEQNKIGSDLCINVLNDQKPNFSCSGEKSNLSPKYNFCTNAIDQNLKTSRYIHDRKKISVADLLSRYFFQEQLQLNHVNEIITSASSFCSIDNDDQIKPKSVPWLFKHETVIPSLKDDCHPGLAHFGNQLPIRNDKEVVKSVVKTLESFLFDAVQPIQVPIKNQSRKMLKRYANYFFLILIMRIQLGVENHETIFPTELISF